MNNRKDDIKSFRLQQENDYISIELIEEMAKKITDDLVEWANTNIFRALGGTLSLKIPTLGPPNARAITYWERPYSPVIEIRLSMFQEIYKDAFAFTLISKKMETETNNIDNFNETFSELFNINYMFSKGIPDIPLESIKGNLNLYFCVFLDAYKDSLDKTFSDNDIVCRFVMFELVVCWIFFHELGHLVQRHYMLKTPANNNIDTEILEISEQGSKSSPDIPGQAREVMADIEGIDLTLKYMKRKGILNNQSLYILLCGVNCMYQRFYQEYETNLDLSKGSHPHPVIRNEFFHSFILNWMIKFLGGDKSTIAKPLIYLSVRSSYMSGLFWAHRLEVYNGEGLPTYMDLSSKSYHAQKEEYMQIIQAEVMSTISIVKNTHIMPSNCIEIFEEILAIQITQIQ